MKSAIASTGGFAALRKFAREIRWVRSSWYLALELLTMINATPGRQRAAYETLFARSVDPWGYEVAPERLQREISMLAGAAADRRFARALELGCAEGRFTEMLAPYCDYLIAADFSPTALARARARHGWPRSVAFVELDLATAELPRGCDLIAVVDVLDDLARPWRIREVRDKIVAALVPGAMLIVGNPRANAVIENSAWGRMLVRGGRSISAFFGRHPALVRIAEHCTDDRIDTLFRRVT